MTKQELKDIIKECFIEEGIIAESTMTLEEETDMIYEMSVAAMEDDEFFYEGANIDLVLKGRECRKEFRNQAKACKKAYKLNNLKEANARLDKMSKCVADFKKYVKAADFTLGENVLSPLVSCTTGLWRSLALCFVPGVGLGHLITDGVAASQKVYDEWKDKDVKGEQAFNSTRGAMLVQIAQLENAIKKYKRKINAAK